MNNEQFELLTEAEATTLARCTVRHMRACRKRGTGPAYIQFGERAIRYEKAKVVAWLRAKTQTPIGVAA